MKYTIIIPTRNRPQSLHQCLAACRALESPGGAVEIIVVDDGSQPPVAPVEGVVLIRESGGGPARARNRGIQSATGDLIAFLDDDCVPHPRWLATLAAAHRDTPEALLGGHTRNGLPENVYSAASQCLVDYLYEFLPRRRPELNFFTTNNCAGSRARLLALGGFDPSFPLAAAEDRDLGERWGLLRHVPEAIVEHRHHLSLGRYLRQHFRYGRGAHTLFRRRSARGVIHRAELRGFLPGLFVFAFGKREVRYPIAVTALLLLSQAAGFAGFVVEAFSTPRFQPRS
jgi:glycosyltransferase involved in cell wall biosynthesis